MMESFMQNVDYYRTVPISLWFVSSATILERAIKEVSDKISELEWDKRLLDIQEKNTISMLGRYIKQSNVQNKPPDKQKVYRIAGDINRIQQENLRVASIIESYRATLNTLQKYEYQGTVLKTMKNMIYLNAKKGLSTKNIDSLTDKFDDAVDNLNSICDAFATSNEISRNFHEPVPLIGEKETEDFLSRVYATIGEAPKYKIYNDNLATNIAISLKEAPTNYLPTTQ